MARRPLRIVALVAVVVASTALGGGRPAVAAPPGPGFAAGDYCLGQCSYILPPGENGNATLAQLLAFKALGIRPAHFSDQLGRYQSLVWNYAGLSDGQLPGFFNGAASGVPGN